MATYFLFCMFSLNGPVYMTPVTVPQAMAMQTDDSRPARAAACKHEFGKKAVLAWVTQNL